MRSTNKLKDPSTLSNILSSPKRTHLEIEMIVELTKENHTRNRKHSCIT